jgi:hypothetical protein
LSGYQRIAERQGFIYFVVLNFYLQKMKNYYKDMISLSGNEIEQTEERQYEISKINGHIHTPHSFSAFSDIEQPFKMATAEGIRVLGINDFYTTDGYDEFAEYARAYKVFPLFNIEFMALQKSLQENGIRVNDPQNPGRTYLSGKGLCFPASMSYSSQIKLQTLQRESNRQTYQMIDKLNQFLQTTSIGISFDAALMQQKLAKNLLRERHIATAVRLEVFEKFANESERISAITEIFSGKVPRSPINNMTALENEIRNNLLKAGGPAYVEEDESAFLSLDEVIELIKDAGGIPCYPVLLDDGKGNFTDFEADFPIMAETLKAKGIYMVELIPGRNDFSILKEFVRYFDQQGFVITFGTEHNTPQLDPLTVTCRGVVALDEELMSINYKGAAVIAAHQYLSSQGNPGFPTSEFPSTIMLEEMEKLGKQVISNFINH